MEELTERAKMLAKATGRSIEDVMADLLDDGVLNESNRAREEPKDLITQLKEAAALITTVQEINKEVSENKVLNGGDNKTDVKIETTLEGDVVDRAIASAQRKADDLKKLAATLIPIFLLLTGGSMEAFGIINVLGTEENNDDTVGVEDPYFEYGGCKAPDAANYDPDADYDDGSCWWDDNNGGGGGPPCDADWRWDAVTIQDFDANGEGFNNDLQIAMTFNDWNKCNQHMQGYFSVEIWDEDRGFMWDQYQIDNYFHDQYTIDDHHYDLDEGQYVVRVDYHFDDSFWEGPSALVTLEANDPQPVYGCTDSEATNYDDKATEDDGSCEYSSSVDDCSVSIENHYRGHEGDNPDSTTMIVGFDVVSTNCDTFSIDWSIKLFQEGYTANYTRTGSISGGQGTVFETFEDMTAGTWIPKIRAVVEGDEKWEMNFWSLDIVEPASDHCDINLYQIQFVNNDTHASVAYDLDCGYGSEPGGYNVSIQFSVIENGTYEPLLDYQVTQHYITGYVEDIYTLTLSNFTIEGATNYDFHWLAIWGDDDPLFIERMWDGIAFEHPDDDPEPQPCENLTITSESLVLSAYGSDLAITWNLTHDGPIANDCYIEVEIFITIYQNGSYYNVSEYHQNPTFMVFNNHDGNQTMFMGSAEIALFDDLPPGEYEILAKYRIKDTSEASSDHFANMVTIS